MKWVLFFLIVNTVYIFKEFYRQVTGINSTLVSTTLVDRSRSGSRVYIIDPQSHPRDEIREVNEVDIVPLISP